MERRTVSGLFDDRMQAERAIQALMNAGYTRNDISVTMRDRQDTRQLAEDTGTKAGEAAGAGAVTGTVLGGLGGLLVGAGLLAIPGIGPILAAGQLAAVVGSGTAIAGATAAGAGIGAAAGGLIGALVGLGIPEEQANTYAEGVRRGGVLVLVHANDESRYAHAASILRSNGAVDVDARRNEYRAQGWERFDEKAPDYDLNDRGTLGAGTGAGAVSSGIGAGATAGGLGASTMGSGTSASGGRVVVEADAQRADRDGSASAGTGVGAGGSTGSGSAIDKLSGSPGGTAGIPTDRDLRERGAYGASGDLNDRGTMGDAAMSGSGSGIGAGLGSGIGAGLGGTGAGMVGGDRVVVDADTRGEERGGTIGSGNLSSGGTTAGSTGHSFVREDDREAREDDSVTSEFVPLDENRGDKRQ